LKNFEKYKSQLKSFLSKEGKYMGSNPMYCFSPDHENSNSEAMLIYDTYFQCQSCGIHGDIYDAVGILKGIPNKNDQYDYVARICGEVIYEPQPENPKFTPDGNSISTLLSKLEKIPGADEHIRRYLEERKTLDKTIDAIIHHFYYWPGLNRAIEMFGKDLLYKCGVRFKGKNGGPSNWTMPGAVLKMGRGLKLFYYDRDGKSQKYHTKGGLTFPFPYLPAGDTIHLVEAEINALAMDSEGYPTIALGGINGSFGVEKLSQYKRAIICLDGDKKGNLGADRLNQALVKKGYKGEILIARLPKGKDPDDLIKEGRRRELQNAIDAATDKVAMFETPPPFQFIGYDSKNYHIWPRTMSIPITIGRQDNNIKNMMCDIAPLDWWLSKYPKTMRDGEVVINTAQALSWFRAEAQKRGIFDENKIMGSGVHKVGKEIILNTGEGLVIGEQHINYSDYSGKALFCRSKNIFTIGNDSWTEKEGQKLFDKIHVFGFEKELDFILLLGWCSLAPFASVLHRRPHIAISAGKGSGKTTLIDNLIRPAMGEISLSIEGKVTEPGIRQSIGKDCRPVILDEFEIHSKEDLNRITSIYSLARSAYSMEGEIVKGTTGSSPIVFKPKTMFCFFAVNITMTNDADRSRIPILKMSMGSGNPEIDMDFEGLRSRIFKNSRKVLEDIEDAKSYIKELTGSPRSADTYGTLIGGFWSTVSDKSFMDDEKYAHIVKNACYRIEDYQIDKTDEESLLDTLFNHIVKEDGMTLTIGQMLTGDTDGVAKDYVNGVQYEPSTDDWLKKATKYGFKVDKNKDGIEYFAINEKSEFIKGILKDTAFADYRQILQRHPAIINDGKTIPIRMAGKVDRCLLFDWEVVKKLHFEVQEEVIKEKLRSDAPY